MQSTTRKFIPLLVLLGVFLLIQNSWRVKLWLNPIDSTALSANDVVMYTTSWCPYCEKARVLFQRTDTPYIEYDVEKSPQAMAEYKNLHGHGVPVIRIGTQVIHGYNPDSIRAAIESLNQQRASQ